MKDFNLVQYSGEWKNAWDDVVQNSKNGNFLHLRDYINYHASRFDERSVLIMKNGETVAVFPCNRFGDKIISHEGLPYGGIIYGTGLHMTEILSIFHQLAEYYRQEGCRRLVYKAIPHIFHRYPAEEDLYALYRSGARLFRRDITSVLPIDEKIRLSDLRKRSVRKSAKIGVETHEGDFFDLYHVLLTENLRKFNVKPVHSLSELIFLKSRFPKNIRLFGGFLGDKLVAGTIVYDFGHVIHTQYIASSDKGREIGALDAVIMYLIENMFTQRRFLSFGISTENEGQYLNQGLIFQKEGFGARGVVHDFYELEI